MAKLNLIQLLPDGRRVAYCEYGATDGYPVIALHGTPGSRLKFGLADEEAKRLGLRLISLDRWGYGFSDAPRGRFGLSDYAADISAFATALGVETFGVVGISGGGPFAVAVAAGLPDRVKALALVAPVSPLSTAEERREVSLFHRFSFRALPRIPGAVPFVFSYFRMMLWALPPLAVRTMSARAGRPDRQVLGRPGVADDLVTTFRAGLARGVGGASVDMRCFSRRWDVDPAAITAPGRMWLGGMDRNVPISAARRLAAQIKTLDVVEYSDAGHFWVVAHHGEVLAWLKEALNPAARAAPQIQRPAAEA